jgi:hypothetical protein
MSGIRRKKQRSGKLSTFNIGESELEKTIAETEKGVAARREVSLPDVIVFDLHGTLDYTNSGVGIPVSALVALKKLGKDVRIFTSSGTFKNVNADADRARAFFAQYNIPLYTNETDAFNGAISGIVVGDKPSDERRAGRHLYKFMSVKDFDLEKFVPTQPDFEAAKALGNKVIEAKGSEIHEQQQLCTCKHVGPHTSACDCIVKHPITEISDSHHQR